MKLNLQKNWWKLMIGFFVLEVCSFLSWKFPHVGNVFYLVVIFTILVLTIRNFSWALLIALTELIIGTQGYLLRFEYQGISVSLRIGLWLIILSVWSVQFLRSPHSLKRNLAKFEPLTTAYILLGLVVLWGVLQGVKLSANWGDIFFDMNGWLYFTYILPWLYFEKRYVSYLWTIFVSGVSWICLKTVVVLYIFSHAFESIIPAIYTWLRDFRLAEITYVSGNFWRVFAQNQSMAMVLFVFVFVWLWLQKVTLKESLRMYRQVWLVGFISLLVIILSYSRSFWLGTALALLVIAVYLLLTRQYTRKKIFVGILSLILGVAVAVMTIQIIVNFPAPYIEPDTGNLISGRIKGAITEAAGGSRLALFKPLRDEIASAWVLGKGFGATVTYFSKDPRVVASSPGGTGEYTTYAFEWGYLDMWLKLGIVGLVIYVYLLYHLYHRGLKNQNTLPFIAGVLPLLFTHLTTPYLNHPLGIGVIVLASYLIYVYEPA